MAEKMRTGFSSSQALRERINPAFFDQELTVLQYSDTTNTIGEKVRAWGTPFTIRALIKELDSSDEMTTKTDMNITLHKVIKVWAWYDARLLSNRNKITWRGKDYNVIDTQEIYGRKRFVFIKIEQMI
jgi:head-tail adaptor